MPKPIAGESRYIPALDGLRAFAVLAVIAFHLGFGWAPGGLLGVGVFFTLSGYLITDLLLARYDRSGSLGMRGFWLGRARRLLPAAVSMLVVVVAWVTVLHPSQLHSMRGAVVAALANVSNWWLIDQHVSYFARFGPPSPLGHLWSLAVEEQFYLIWPWLLLLGLRVMRAPTKLARLVTRPRLAAATLVLAAASAVLMAVLYRPSLDSTRVYDGTDTRAFGLLIGAALAMVWPSRRLAAKIAPSAHRLKDTAAALALGAIVVMIWRTNEYSPFLYHGGLVLLSIATAIVVAAVVHPVSVLGRLLGIRPLRWLGVRSYGLYLWHFPIITLTNPVANPPVNLVRAGVQVAATVVVAALSWRFIEEPVRRGVLRRWWAQRTSSRWRAVIGGWRIVAITASVAVLATACVGMSTTRSPLGVVSASSSGPASSDSPTPSPSSSPPAETSSSASSVVTVPSAASVPKSPIAQPPPAATTTSCTSVVHIGDSTSEGLISPDYLADPALRITAQYTRVGATDQHIEISGGTSILETVKAGEENAYQVAQRLIASGYKGCWVLALGTNDTADVYVGSVLNQAQRIEKMMALIGSMPVMWVNVKSLVPSGPYASGNMQKWNAVLAQDCGKYPSMRIYDWASAVQDGWFISDQIHFTSTGYAARSKDIADALVHAFPATGTSGGCLVN
jgi:peptidoglycan/LPS O-acetylase OafA/YrhL